MVFQLAAAAVVAAAVAAAVAGTVAVVVAAAAVTVAAPAVVVPPSGTGLLGAAFVVEARVLGADNVNQVGITGKRRVPQVIFGGRLCM